MPQSRQVWEEAEATIPGDIRQGGKTGTVFVLILKGWMSTRLKPRVERILTSCSKE